MQSALRPYATAGVALVGASVIAVSPVTVTPTAAHEVRDAAPRQADRTVRRRQDEAAFGEVGAHKTGKLSLRPGIQCAGGLIEEPE